MTATPTQKLEPYLGRDVPRATLEIRGTGSGLDKSMVMPPIALPPGHTVDVVLRCVVDKHRHELDDDDGTFTLVNMLRAETASLVEDGGISVKQALATAEERVAERRAELEAAKRSADGEDPLPFEAGHDEPDAAERAIRARTELEEVEALEAAADDQDDDDA